MNIMNQLQPHEPVTIAVVIPAYNEARNLGSCLQSIARQTVMPNQVIVVNNNSSDATAAIAASFPFVTLLSEPRQGIVYARNTGFDAVTADIIGRIDADTRLKPGWVEHVRHYYSVASHMQRGVSGQGYFYNVRWPKFAGKAQHAVAFKLNKLIMGGYILWGSNMALPRTLWLSVREQLEQRIDIHEDIDLAIHLQRSGYKVDYRKSLLVGVQMRRVHTNRRALWANLQMWPRTFRAHGYRLWPLALAGSVFLYLCVLPFTLIEKLSVIAGGSRFLKRRGRR